MPISLSLDRIEDNDLAVLVTDDGQEIHLPKALLPGGAKAGDVLKCSLEVDPAATKALKDDAKALQQDLKKTDPGGDLSI